MRPCLQGQRPKAVTETMNLYTVAFLNRVDVVF